jgi:hypothetical protein
VLFVGILIGLLVVGVLVLTTVGLRVRGSVVRFGEVRGAMVGHVADRSGLLRARSAALGVAVSDLRPPPFGNRSSVGGPRTIGNSKEREDNRA